IDIVSQGTLQAIAAGDIAIDQSQGDLYVLDVLSKSGDVALGAQGFLINGGNLVDPTKLDSGLAVGNAGANVRGNTILLNPDATAMVTAGKADLSAAGSVGSGNLRIGGLSGRIVSTVGNVEAIATTGSIWLWNKGALTVGGVVPVVNSPYAMYAPNGSVNIQ